MTADDRSQQAAAVEGAASPRQQDDLVALDREYTEEELHSSPYRDVMKDAVVAGPDEYRSGPSRSAPRLQDVVRAAITRNVADGDLSDADRTDATAGVLAALREVCTISSVEQLDALTDGVVVIAPGAWDQHGAWTKDDEGLWFHWSMDYGEPSSRIELPALLVWSPDWSA